MAWNTYPSPNPIPKPGLTKNWSLIKKRKKKKNLRSCVLYDELDYIFKLTKLNIIMSFVQDLDFFAIAGMFNKA